MARLWVAMATGLHMGGRGGGAAWAPSAPSTAPPISGSRGITLLLQVNTPATVCRHLQMMWDRGKKLIRTDAWFKMLPTSAHTQLSCNQAQNILRLSRSSVEWPKNSCLAFGVVPASAHTECRKGGSRVETFCFFNFCFECPTDPWTQAGAPTRLP